MNWRRRWRIWFGLLALTLLGAVALVTALVLRLERGRLAAQAEAARQDSIRLALWRLEGILVPALALEAQRPPRDYEPFSPERVAYTRLLHQIRPGEVLTPSPLLTWRSDAFPVHFQCDADGALTSPQVPAGNLLDLALASYRTLEQIERSRALLDELRADLTPAVLEAHVRGGEERLHHLVRQGPLAPVLESRPDVAAQQVRTAGEWNVRGQNTAATLVNAGPLQQQALAEATPGPEGVAEISPLVPFWVGPSEAPRLVYARRVQMGEVALHQGFLCSFEHLRGLLLHHVQDLLPGAELRPAPADTASIEGTLLVSMPAELLAPPAVVPPAPLASPERLALGGLWITALAGLVAAAMALRATIVFGEKKSRFASAVTHELRTPLTTFCMYAEMLAEGMVPEPERAGYLDVLKCESLRLSALVESVLAYARVEEGKRRPRADRFTVGTLIERLLPELERRAAAAGLQLHLDCSVAAEVVVRTDPEALALILGNVVDNAGKYAAEGERALDVRVLSDRGRVAVDLRDHGPGIDAGEAAAVFEAFERGAAHRDGVPGLGLGLALSRALARECGGDLRLLRHAGKGAWFRLTLDTPRAG